MNLKNTYLICFISALIFSCARQGAPTGGPKDVSPPKVLKSTPENLSKNVDTNLKEIKLLFDELILIKDSYNQIVISPPMQEEPSILPNTYASKEITIKFKDSLQKNTTYSFNFGESIQDNNEGNPLSNFKYVFSTGNFIDSLEIKGKISDYLTNEFKDNILVALYKNDSVIDYTKKPYYVSKVDSSSMYNFQNLKKGKYKIIAFNDENKNRVFDSDTEKIGFKKELIDLDSTQKNIDLKLSKVQKKYKIISQKQEDYGQILFEFEGNPDSLNITAVEPKIDTFLLSHIARSDSARFWFKQDNIFTKEEKNPKITFLVENKEKKDTVFVYYKTNKEHKTTVEKRSTILTPDKKLYIQFNSPLVKVDKSFISVKKEEEELPFVASINNENKKQLDIDFPVKLDSKYVIELEPNSIVDFFGSTTDSTQFMFQTRAEKDFGKLKLELENKPKTKFFLELLNAKGDIIEKVYTNESTFNFDYLAPGEYSFRILVDENENGFYDYADFENEIYAEKTYLYSNKILIRAYWEITEKWILNN